MEIKCKNEDNISTDAPLKKASKDMFLSSYKSEFKWIREGKQLEHHVLLILCVTSALHMLVTMELDQHMKNDKYKGNKAVIRHTITQWIYIHKHDNSCKEGKV